MSRDYAPSDALSIFRYSGRLLQRTLAQVVPVIDPTVSLAELDQAGKGGLGMLVEKYFFGYGPNSSPDADFAEAGVELKVSPLKKTRNDELAIKERLVCDMIDYMSIVDEEFEDSRFFRKSVLMLIIFYLHVSGAKRQDLQFIYSILWQIKDKDLLIIRNDFLIIRDKVRQGRAHELSEGDTMYLGACRKGQRGQAPRRQPCNCLPASARAFSLKTAYMRTVLDYARARGASMATNLTNDDLPGVELVTAEELQTKSFEEILRDRFVPFFGLDYKGIADKLGIEISSKDKSRNATAVRNIMLKGLRNVEDAEEIRKAGIKVKTIRIERSGRIREHMSFENIDYQEILDNDDWVESRWYEIVTTRYMFILFRDNGSGDYILDRIFFWTMPASDIPLAEQYWLNIRANVLADTLTDDTNTFWKISDGRSFHVRPKAQNAADTALSPISRKPVPKKAYWFDSRYLRKEIMNAYGDDWNQLFTQPKKSKR